MDDSLSLALPNAALRALVESVVSNAPDQRFIELSIRTRETKLNVRELSSYLALLDGIYGRLDSRGFRSYAQQPANRLEISRVSSGSIEFEFLFDLLQRDEVWKLLLMYIIAKVGPDLLRGEIAKNWAEAAKAGVETYNALIPPRESSLTFHTPPLPPPSTSIRELPSEEEKLAVPVRLTRKQEQQLNESESLPSFQLTRNQRKQIGNFMKDDPNFSRLSARHRKQVIDLVEGVLGQERHHLPAAIRFSRKCVIEVSVRLRTEG